MHPPREMSEIMRRIRGNRQILGVSANDSQSLDQSLHEYIRIAQLLRLVSREYTGALQALDRLQCSGDANAAIGITDFDLPGLYKVFQIDEAAQTVLGARGPRRHEFRRLALTKTHDVLIVQRLTRIDELVADVEDPVTKHCIAGDRAQFDQRQPLELPRRSTGQKILRKTIQRARQAPRLAVRPQTQIDLKNPFAPRHQRLQEKADELLKIT